MEESEYRFERFSEEKIDDLLYMFRAIDHPFPPGFFNKKFDTSFTGISNVGYIAYHKKTSEPAAYYGVFPVFLNMDGRPVLAAQSGDTITHPGHQKKGLFIALAQKTYELCRELNIHIVFGFPNHNSSHGFFHRLNWVVDGKIFRYAVPMPTGLFKKVMRKIMPTLFYRLRFKRFNTFQPGQQYAHDITVFKNQSYLNYKGFSEKYVYSNDDVSISFKFQYDLHIGNIYFHKKISSERLIQILTHLSNITYTDRVIMHFSEFMTEHTQCFSKYMQAGEFFENGRLDLVKGYENKHLIFSFEDFDSF
jgi:hypothetical protein